MGLNRISRAKRDQTWREDIVTSGISRVEGIAVDWMAGSCSPCLGLHLNGARRKRPEGLVTVSLSSHREPLLDRPRLQSHRNVSFGWRVPIAGHIGWPGSAPRHRRPPSEGVGHVLSTLSLPYAIRSLLFWVWIVAMTTMPFQSQVGEVTPIVIILLKIIFLIFNTRNKYLRRKSLAQFIFISAAVFFFYILGCQKLAPRH